MEHFGIAKETRQLPANQRQPSGMLLSVNVSISQKNVLEYVYQGDVMRAISRDTGAVASLEQGLDYTNFREVTKFWVGRNLLLP